MALQQVARVGLPARLPSEFRCHVGMAPTSAAGECAGASLAVRFAPRSPPRCGSCGGAWEPARESGGDADRIDRSGGGARGPAESTADAREDMSRPTERTPVPTNAGVSRPLNRGRLSAPGGNIVGQQRATCGGGSAYTGRADPHGPHSQRRARAASGRSRDRDRTAQFDRGRGKTRHRRWAARCVFRSMMVETL